MRGATGDAAPTRATPAGAGTAGSTPTDPELRQMALSLLSQVRVMTLATAGPSGPWASTLAFAFDDAFKLYFVSKARSRHVHEIAGNDRVSVALHEEQPGRYDPQRVRGVQIQGRAAVLAGAELERGLGCYIARFPEAEPYLKQRVCSAGTARIVCIRPTLLRLTDRARFSNAVTLFG